MDKLYVLLVILLMLVLVDQGQSLTTGTVQPLLSSTLGSSNTSRNATGAQAGTISTTMMMNGTRTTLHPKLNIDKATYVRYMQLLNYWQYLGAKWLGGNR